VAARAFGGGYRQPGSSKYVVYRAAMSCSPLDKDNKRNPMIFNWFDTKEESAFGGRLAEFFDTELKALEGKSGHKQDDKRRKLVVRVMQQAKQFGATRKLNPYKKAKLANTFKWRLRDLGHDDALIDQLTKDILLNLR
jgi:hypothetical protein